LSFDEPDEVVILEDSVEQQNSFVIFGVSQVDYSSRPLQGILLQLTGVQRGQYRRIGFFRVHEFGQDQRYHFSALTAAFGAMDMPEQYYEHRGNDWYEFMIV
jgi:hypothetical protein